MKLPFSRAAIPNAVTALCLLFGYLSIINTMQGEYLHAAYFTLYAGFLDAADGTLAKMLRATSAAGAVFDSLSDLATFGLAPALLIYRLYLAPWGTPGMLISGVFVVAAAARLARYTAGQASNPSSYFAGLPMPLAMGLVSGFVPFCNAIGQRPGPAPIAAALALIAAYLMVSNVPYERSMQFAARRVARTWKRNLFALFLVTTLLAPMFSFFAWSILLTVGGMARTLVLSRSRRFALLG
jgi:CDP-diacylglycerol---serine O-phosphatidyltransferase